MLWLRSPRMYGCVVPLMKKLDDSPSQPQVEQGENSRLSAAQLTVAGEQVDALAMTEQQSAYMFGRMTGGGGGCQLYQEFERNSIDVDQLEEVINALINRHDMLRCVILPDGSQGLLRQVPRYRVKEFLLDDKKAEDKAGADQGGRARYSLEAIRHSMTDTPFAMGEWPFFQFCVSRGIEGSDRLHCVVDLQIADGNSIHLLFQQIIAACESDSQRAFVVDAVASAPLNFSFSDYLTQKKSLLAQQKTSGQWEGKKRYWQEKFSQLSRGPELTSLKRSSAGPKQAGRPDHKRLLGYFGDWDKLTALAEREQVSVNSLLLTAYSLVLLQSNKHADFALVIPSWEREALHNEVELLLGDFTRMGWLEVSGEKTSLSQRLQQVHASLQADYHQRIDSPLALLKNTLYKQKKGLPYFPVVFTDLLPHGQYQLQQFTYAYGESKTPGVILDNISVLINDRLLLAWDFDCEQLDEQKVASLFVQYQALLSAFVESPSLNQVDTLLSHPTALPATPHVSAVTHSTELSINTNEMKLEKVYPGSFCLHRYVEEQVLKTPDSTAVVFEDRTLNYSQLNQYANYYAHQLIDAGLKANDVVAVVMNRSLEMVVSLLAILKAGGAYLPLDPASPQSRLAYILEDAQVASVLTTPNLSEGLNGLFSARTLLLDLDTLLNLNGQLDLKAESLNGDSSQWRNPQRDVLPEHLAYVIYTSGSTGNPKGCMLPHRAASHRILWMQDEYQLGEMDRVLQKTPYSFDVSVWEFFWPLMFGAQLILAKPGGHKDSRYLVDFICHHKISVCHFVPSMLAFFLSEAEVSRCYSLRMVFVSGEALPYATLCKFQGKLPAQLHNLYGPTEAAIDVTYWACEQRADKKVPIGRPITNVLIHILDEQLKPVAPGQEGELHIGGIALAHGYLNKPEKTAEKFIPSPFEPGGKLYKTGDLAKYLSDGNIEYIGRLDFQVKLRGNRIELGEIENTLRLYPEVEDAVVLVKESDSVDPKLVAYYVCQSKTVIASKLFRAFLAETLPEYCIPNFFVAINAMPVSAHGKLDRKQLPWPVSERGKVLQVVAAKSNAALKLEIASEQEAAPAQNTAAATTPSAQEIKAKIINKITTLLHTDSLSASDDLFDLGLTSLTLVNIGQFVESEFAVAISTADLFDTFMSDPTVAWITQAIISALAAHDAESDAAKEVDLDAGVAEAAQASQGPGRQALTEKVINKLRELLRIDTLAVDDDLFDHGATSLTLVNFGQYIERELGAKISPSDFFDGFMAEPSVAWLVAQILAQIQASSVPDTQSPVAETPLVNPSSADKAQLGQEILRILAQSLNEQIGLDDDLFDHGATSLTLISSGQQISEKYQLELSASDFFGEFMVDPTVRWIVDYIAQKLDVARKEDSATQTFAAKPALAEKSKSLVLDLEYVKYIKPDIGLRHRSPALSLTQISALLNELRAYPNEDQSREQSNESSEYRYLFPSVGGKQAVQSYLYLPRGAEPGLASGCYYYHPQEHALYPVAASASDSPVLDPLAGHQDLSQADFALFFVAQLKALAPIYQNHSIRLATLEAGYMAQLLENRQVQLELSLQAMPQLQFPALGEALQLHEGHHFIMALAGWTDSAALRRVFAQPQQSPDLSVAERDSFYRANDLSTLHRPSDQELQEMQAQNLHLRHDIADHRAIALHAQPLNMDRYHVRRCERAYRGDVIGFSEFSRFLALLSVKDREKVSGKESTTAADYLYQLSTDKSLLETFVFVKAGAVQGLDEGLYQYLPHTHQLSLRAKLQEKHLLACHVPFNRAHFKSSQFTLFLVSAADFDETLLRQGLLESGRLGQLLIEHQAEFNIGLCPLGGINFERIKEAFQLPDNRVLVHQLIGGAVKRRGINTQVNALALDSVAGTRSQGHIDGRSSDELSQEIANTRDVDNTLSGEFAIVGLSGRYPGAESAEALWQNLREGQRSVAAPDSARQQLNQGSELPHGAYLRDIDCFDSLLFNISPMEAQLMDPQERLFLETVWACLDNAGYTAQSLKQGGAVGVFAGAMWNDYLHVGGAAWMAGQEALATSLHSDIANRVSHFFDLSGPSISVGTSCSSALSAVHFACQSIARGECQAAIAGGVNIVSHGYHTAALAAHELLASGDKSRAFSAEGSGWVVGEGSGAVLIKPLAKAEADGDHIYCVIKGSASHHVGRSPRYGMANSASQAQSIQRLLDTSHVDAAQITYVECAAGGASLADASEVNALVNSLSAQAGPDCRLGSLKPNIGHSESASGMAQLTKVIFQMRHGELAPSLDSEPVSPLIQLQNTRFTINQQLSAWQRPFADAPLTALINGFGASGSCAHLIVAQYQPAQTSSQAQSQLGAPELVVLSAASLSQLQESCRRLAACLERRELPAQSRASGSADALANIAWTLKSGRVAMEHRLAIIADNEAQLIEELRSFAAAAQVSSARAFYGNTEDPSNGASQSLHESTSDLSHLAAAWIGGRGIVWDERKRCCKLALPTYPFAKQRHWLPSASSAFSPVLSEGTGQQFEQADKLPQSTAPNNNGLNNNSAHNKGVNELALQRKVRAYLRDIFARGAGMSAEQVKGDKDFSSYGINSLMITRMNALLAKDFGDLPKSVFFEHTTINALADYFVEKQIPALKRCFADDTTLWQSQHTAAAARQHATPLSALSRPSAPRTAGQTKASAQSEPAVAIVGMSGRFPEAGNLDEFWHNLKAGKTSIRALPKARAALSEPFLDLDCYPQAAGYIDDVSRFDPLFFGISPAWAEMMDPQERLFLEVAWEAMEHAGYSQAALQDNFQGQVGVYLGVMYNEYQMLGPVRQSNGELKALSPGFGSIANRVSYHLGLSGPSMAIDTMCSSSLTATHLACEAIRRGECQLAIVGGVNVLVHANKAILHQQFNMNAQDNLCKSFGEGGDGFVAGEGIGALMLKSLSQAELDGDRIYAVINGSMLNHGGKTNAYTVPSPKAQRDLIRAALDRWQLDARQISYIEAHGTGTALGDPIEFEGLTDAFRSQTEDKQFCALGSVKSNIGHLESAAGVAALCKVLLQFQHKQLVPSLHAERSNPDINFDDSPFYLQRSLQDWQAEPRRAGISSFGAGGSNAHVILEEYAEADTEADSQAQDQALLSDYAGPWAFVLSAKSALQLQAYVGKYLSFIAQRLDALANSDTDSAKLRELRLLRDMSFTLQLGRDAFSHRFAVAVDSLSQLHAALQSCVNEGLEGQAKAQADAGFYWGSTSEWQQLDVLTGLDEDVTNEMVSALARKGDLEKILQLWVKGISVNWADFFPVAKPRRVALPTYPFANEHYWVSGQALNFSSAAGKNTLAHIEVLHPLIDKNTSTLRQQKYAKTLHGNEFYMRDHRLKGRKTLPGVVHIEMARAAGSLASENTIFRISEVSWFAPVMLEESLPDTANASALVVSASKDIELLLEPEEKGIRFRLVSEDKTGASKTYSTGLLQLEKNSHATPMPEFLDVNALRLQCQRRLSGADFYQLAARTSLEYGPSFKAIDKVYYDTHGIYSEQQGGQQALVAFAEEFITAMETDQGEQAGWLLAPAMLDGALQACWVLLVDPEADQLDTYIPYFIEEIKLLDKSAWHYAYIEKTTEKMRSTKNSLPPASARRQNETFDIKILGQHGEVLLKVGGFVLRNIKLGSVESDLINEENKATTLSEMSLADAQLSYFCENWQAAELSTDESALPHRKNSATGILVFDADKEFFQQLLLPQTDLAEQGSRIFVQSGKTFCKHSNLHYEINYHSEQDLERFFIQLAESKQEYSSIVYRHQSEKNILPFYALNYLAKAIIRHDRNRQIKLLYVSQDSQASDYAVSGFFRSLEKEHSKINARVLMLADKLSIAQQLPIILQELMHGAATDRLVKYQGKRMLRGLQQQVAAQGQADHLPIKQGGSYLITGGLGGLGYIFAQYLARKYEAVLILNGRSALDENKRRKLALLQGKAREVYYVQADVTVKTDCEKLLQFAREKGKGIDGLIHAAGTIDDGLLLNKTRERNEAVLLPKIDGSLNLDTLAAADELDFFVLFSSLVGQVGNLGQSDYAYANVYMDGIAQHREQLRKQGLRSGLSCSIAWPYWQGGGMQIEPAQAENFFQAFGIVPLAEELGTQAFEQALSFAKSQLVVLSSSKAGAEQAQRWLISEGQVEQLENIKPKKPFPVVDRPVVPQMQAETLFSETAKYLRALFAEETKLSIERIDENETLDRYGIDSIMILNVTNALEKVLGSISHTMFFEYQTVHDLSCYMVDSYADALNAHFAGLQATVESQAEALPRQQSVAKNSQENVLAGKRVKYLQQAAESISDTREEATDRDQDIAIIGLSGRYPMADDLSEFWQNLASGRDCISEIPAQRWSYLQNYDADSSKEGACYAKWGGFLNDIDQFDPMFFKITPTDANYLDPQQRLFLETVYQAMEDAGYTKDNLAGAKENRDVGVFAGVMWADYRLWGIERYQRDKVKIPHASHWGVTNRISYCFDFQGPSCVVDTACSSSLTAIHMAVESLRKRECSVAIAGGVNLSIHPSKFQILSEDKFASTDGRCRSFGEGGDGYVPGEGVGAIILKPCKQAEKDGDHIYAVIKSSSLNHGGKTNGFTVPNPKAQAKLIKKALDSADIDPQRISYIEAHGTGTSLGDPIEISGLKEAFEHVQGNMPRCAIGSVKSNIGHLEGAAGIAGVTKILLQMKHNKLVPSIHCEPANPKIQLQGSPFYVQKELSDWAPAQGGEADLPRVAAISSFGAGGANAHLIIEQHPDKNESVGQYAAQDDADQTEIFVLSAKAHDVLGVMAENLIAQINSEPALKLADIAYTLQRGRENFRCKVAFVANSRKGLLDKLAVIEKLDFDAQAIFWSKNGLKAKTFIEGYASELDYVEECLRNNIAGLAQYWSAGGEVDWALLKNTKQAKRVSLPTYPFDRDSYWLPYSPLNPKEADEKGSLAVQTVDQQEPEQEVSIIVENA